MNTKAKHPLTATRKTAQDIVEWDIICLAAAAWLGAEQSGFLQYAGLSEEQSSAFWHSVRERTEHMLRNGPTDPLWNIAVRTKCNACSDKVGIDCYTWTNKQDHIENTFGNIQEAIEHDLAQAATQTQVQETPAVTKKGR